MVAAKKQPKSAVLCLHGTGSNEAIFKLQLAQVRLALKDDLEFIFMNAPYVAGAGPGVLPLFEGAQPFYGWFSNFESSTIQSRLGPINKAVQQAVEGWQSNKANPDCEIVGIIAFSEGALVAALLMHQQQLGQVPWLPKIRFATLFCCYFAHEASEFMLEQARANGKDRALIDVPTLHMLGRRDFCLARARSLANDHYTPEFAEVVEFDGGHQLPTTRGDREKVVNGILTLIRRIASPDPR